MQSKSAKVTGSHHNGRFDIVASSLFNDISRKKIKEIIDAGGAYLNKKRVSVAKFAVYEGDKLELFWNEKSNKKTPLSADVVLFENDDFLVVNKPACIATQATLESSKDTIIHALNKSNPQKFKLDRLFLVHRLDKETSGILLIAKTKNAQKEMEDLFREKKVHKIYHALCFHVPKSLKGSISFPIAKDRARQNCYFAITNSATPLRDAKLAHTDYQVIKNYSVNDMSHIECFPQTGRTHQLRVHLLAIGCPVAGDKTYARNIYGHRHLHIALRHMLHASHIEFEFKGNKFQFQAPLPDDFLAAITTLEKNFN